MKRADMSPEQLENVRAYHREYIRGWRERNPERWEEIRRASEARRNVDPARHTAKLAAMAAWRERNADAVRAHDRERNALPERRRQQNDRKRMRRNATEGCYVDPLVVLERDDGVCYLCGEDVDPADFHVDHVVPLVLGGRHDLANMRATHPTCNRRKSDRLPEEMA